LSTRRISCSTANWQFASISHQTSDTLWRPRTDRSLRQLQPGQRTRVWDVILPESRQALRRIGSVAADDYADASVSDAFRTGEGPVKRVLRRPSVHGN
jgi:hypothetical protein